MGRALTGAMALALVLGGCGDGGDDDDAGSSAAPVDEATGAEEGDEAAGGPAAEATGELSTEDPAVQDAILLTAVDEVLADTRFTDLVDEDPGAFLETADTLCSSLDAGADGDTVLGDLLTELAAEGLELDEDTAYLGGALLGAAVTVRCPEHEDEIAEVAS